jgi:phosphatidylinositol glycan class A protein
MLFLAEPEPNSIIAALEEAIMKAPFVSPWEFHENVRRFYSWDWVAERTERVYDRIAQNEPVSISERLIQYSTVGKVYGVVCMMLCALDWLLHMLLCLWMPEHSIDVAVDFPVEGYTKNRDKLIALEREMGGS